MERLQKLSADGYTRAEIEAYEKQRKIRFTEKAVAREEGMEKGMEKGRKEERREMAQNTVIRRFKAIWKKC